MKLLSIINDSSSSEEELKFITRRKKKSDRGIERENDTDKSINGRDMEKRFDSLSLSNIATEESSVPSYEVGGGWWGWLDGTVGYV